MKDSLLLFSNFLRNPKETGAIMASSKYLTKEIIKNIDFEKSKNIVELGPGLGTFTRVILKRSKPDSRIFCFDVNKSFCDYLSKNINDSRIRIINAGADSIKENLKGFNASKADCIISGLPFRNFSEHKKRKIIKEVKSSLGREGRFVLFQYTNGISKLLESNFGRVQRTFVPLNVPPSFVYVCEK